MDNYLSLHRQYTDDIGWASTRIHILKEIEEQVPKFLEFRNLFVNKYKTEKLHISRSRNDNWRNYKYVGSLLGTKGEIYLRTIPITVLKSIFDSDKVLTSTKLRYLKHYLKLYFSITLKCGE